jgi:hypothetical protein
MRIVTPLPRKKTKTIISEVNKLPCYVYCNDGMDARSWKKSRMHTRDQERRCHCWAHYLLSLWHEQHTCSIVTVTDIEKEFIQKIGNYYMMFVYSGLVHVPLPKRFPPCAQQLTFTPFGKRVSVVVRVLLHEGPPP